MSETELTLEVFFSINTYCSIFLRKGDDVIWERYFSKDEAVFAVLPALLNLLEELDKNFTLVPKG